jgi:hypothetical protein
MTLDAICVGIWPGTLINPVHEITCLSKRLLANEAVYASSLDAPTLRGRCPPYTNLNRLVALCDVLSDRIHALRWCPARGHQRVQYQHGALHC